MPSRTSLLQRLRYRLARWLMPDIHELLLHRAAALDSAAERTTEAEDVSKELGVPEHFRSFRPGPPEHWLKLVRESASQLLIDDSEGGLPQMAPKEAAKADDALKVSAQPVQSGARPIERHAKQVEVPESTWILSSQPKRKPSGRGWIADVMRGVLSVVSRGKGSSEDPGDAAAPYSAGERAVQSKPRRLPLSRPDKQESRSPSETTVAEPSFHFPWKRPHENSERHAGQHAPDELAHPQQSIRGTPKHAGIVERKRQAADTMTKGESGGANYREQKSAQLPPQGTTKHPPLDSRDAKLAEAPNQRSEVRRERTKMPVPQRWQHVTLPQMQSADFQPALPGCLQAPATASPAILLGRQASRPTESMIERPSNAHSERNRWPRLMKTPTPEDASLAAMIAQQRRALLQREQAGGD